MSDLPTPATRKEQYLNNIATGSGSIPAAPSTRIERYLDAIVQNGGGGGGGGGASAAEDVSYDNTTSGLTATNIQDAIDEVAQGSGGTAQPDFILKGNTSTTPTASDISSALGSIEFKSDIDTMVDKAQKTGGLDIGGCFKDSNLNYYKSIIDYNSTVQVLPSSALPVSYGVTSAYAVLLTLTTACSSDSLYVGIAEIGGTLMCVPLGG